jgi:hypothetical protein
VTGRVDRVTLLAGIVIVVVGGLLLADQVGGLELDFGWLGVILAGAAGAILLASGLAGDRERG